MEIGEGDVRGLFTIQEILVALLLEACTYDSRLKKRDRFLSSISALYFGNTLPLKRNPPWVS